MPLREFPNLGIACRPERHDNRAEILHKLCGRMLLNELTPASVIVARLIPNPPDWVCAIADGGPDVTLAMRREVALEFYFAELLEPEV